jgi:maltose alpha-D-glucosyltransferase/alpha-amylase
MFKVADTGYFMPLTLVWEADEAKTRALRPTTIASIRQQSKLGLLGDACADENFIRSLVAAIGAGREFRCAHGAIRCTPTASFDQLVDADPAQLPVRPPAAQGSNSAVGVGHRLFLKFYRRLQAGIGPEIEVGRFLTEVAGFRQCVPVAGAVEYLADDGTATPLAMLQGYVDNQGDGWTYTEDYLARTLEQDRTAGTADDEAHGAYLALVATLAQRTGELHRALATATTDPAFAAEPATRDDVEAWQRLAAEEALDSLNRLAAKAHALPAAAATVANRLLDRRAELLDRLAAALPDQGGSQKIRIHGDYHLGQVLLAQNDFVIIDFEGEPGRPLTERRKKYSPLRDVAGMLRSFDYAARTAHERAAAGATEKEQPLIAAAAEAWRRQASEAYLAGYRATVAGSGLFGDWSAAGALLDLFVLEKACYELRYELDHRPDRVHLPVNGILATLDGV